MLRRNWLSLARKQIDRYDMDYSFSAVKAAFNEAALAYWGEGVLVTKMYPNPFLLTPSTSVLGGSVGPGISFDPNGQLTRIDPLSTTPNTFQCLPADPLNARWDLLVIRYVQTGDTSIPEPSSPLLSVPLNLHDDFQLVVIPGTPSGQPAYPSKAQATDVILAGLQVPAGASVGTQITLDGSVRDLSAPNKPTYPVFANERPGGVVDGNNTTFVLTQVPIPGSVYVTLDGRKVGSAEFTVSGTQIQFNVPPAIGQTLGAHYVVQSAGSTNPVSIQQENPGGVIDGQNLTFSLQGYPPYKAALVLFIDGLKAPASTWSLVQNSGTAQIVFIPGAQPQIGQTIDAIYFVNVQVAQISTVPAGSGGGGQSTYTRQVYGTPTSPTSFDPTMGLMPGKELDQTWILQSGGGQVAVSASQQIKNGSTIGQRLTLRGVDQVNFYVFSDGSGLSLNGQCLLTFGQALVIEWDGTLWYEITRRG